MTEYESAKPFSSIASSRRWAYGTFLFWAALTAFSINSFGADVWLTRLMLYGLVVTFIGALWAFGTARYDARLKRSGFERITIG